MNWPFNNMLILLLCITNSNRYYFIKNAFHVILCIIVNIKLFILPMQSNCVINTQ